MARRVLGGAILSGFGLYGAYEATNTPNQPQWLRKQRYSLLFQFNLYF